MISHEITWLANPAARASNPDNLPIQPPTAWIAAAQQALPEAQVTQVMRFEDYLVAVVGMTGKDMPAALVYVNPYTAQVQEINQGLTFIGFMRSLHGWLLFPWRGSYSIGYYLVAALSLLVLVALMSGLVVYKRFWRGYREPRLRRSKGARIFWGDWHRLAGIWSIWFLLVIGLTGLWYLAQAILWHNDIEISTDPEPLAITAVPLTHNQETPAMIPLSQAITTALDKMPTLNPTWISIPEHHQDYVHILGGNGAIFYDGYSYGAFINPWNGNIAATRDPANMGLLETMEHLADPLHYGTLGGLATKLVWFVFGLLLTSMSISGFVVWHQRLRKQTASTQDAPQPAFELAREQP